MKKYLALFLALIMIFQMIPVSALADEGAFEMIAVSSGEAETTETVSAEEPDASEKTGAGEASGLPEESALKAYDSNISKGSDTWTLTVWYDETGTTTDTYLVEKGKVVYPADLAEYAESHFGQPYPFRINRHSL